MKDRDARSDINCLKTDIIFIKNDLIDLKQAVWRIEDALRLLGLDLQKPIPEKWVPSPDKVRS